MKSMVRRIGLAVLCRLWGVKLVDQRTGEVIGRVVVVRWKGGLRLIGLNGVAVQPHFLPQATESYWAQDLGFSTHPPPDFPYVENRHRADLPPVASRGAGDVRGVATPES
jgi:hypothetical protein